MKEQRLTAIENFVLATGAVSLDALCDRFSVSKNTIRRDIVTLVDKGVIKKIYGGVTSVKDSLLAFEERNTKHIEEKIAIAKEASKQIEENDLIFIDTGTTTRYILSYVPENLKFTIITNSLDIVNSADRLKNLDLLIIGTHYQQRTRSFVEPGGYSMIEKYNFNKAFMAATGVSFNGGVMNSDSFEYEVKKHVVDKTDKLILMVDASKFGKTTFLTYAPLDRIHTLITTPSIPDDYKTHLKNNNVRVIIADPDQ